MTQTKDMLVGAVIGVHHMQVRAGSYTLPALHDLFMSQIGLLLAVSHAPLLTYSGSPGTMLTTVKSIDGAIDTIRNDDGTGTYFTCDHCCCVENMEYGDCDGEPGSEWLCESCHDKSFDDDDSDVPLDTPALDTSFHDYEMQC